MFCYSKKLEKAGIAIDSYKRIMNNHSNKNFIVKSILNMMSLKTVDFLGSYLIYDKNKENELNKFYGNTTDGDLYDNVKNQLLLNIKKSKKKYMFFCIGSVLYKNDTSHHMIVMLSRASKIKEMNIKIFNSGLYSMEKYQEQIENLVKDIITNLGNKPVFIDNYIGISRFGLFLQKSNPQDYCRGGISGILLSYINYKYAIHNESYCQTWCILMFMYEINAIKKEKDYDINKNYMKNEIKESKYDLELLIRNFILWIVDKFEKQIGFMDEFIDNISITDDFIQSDYKEKKFSKVLEDSFKTLHNDIKINRNINNILYK